MGMISLTIKRDDGEPVTASFGMTDDDLTRQTMYYAATYFPGQTPDMLSLMRKFSEGLIVDEMAKALAWHRAQAAHAAEEAVAPLVATAIEEG